mmetsp:Transcript_85761/g.255673  ORF Transcript_85761/g.255673 Transcript_85761/m.255673 type:complete len:232 (-) Transcript_85761:1135-1830(-)
MVWARVRLRWLSCRGWGRSRCGGHRGRAGGLCSLCSRPSRLPGRRLRCRRLLGRRLLSLAFALLLCILAGLLPLLLLLLLLPLGLLFFLRLTACFLPLLSGLVLLPHLLEEAAERAPLLGLPLLPQSLHAGKLAPRSHVPWARSQGAAEVLSGTDQVPELRACEAAAEARLAMTLGGTEHHAAVLCCLLPAAAFQLRLTGVEPQRCERLLHAGQVPFTGDWPAGCLCARRG